MRAFEAAGRLSSIRRAAAELHVTPAAISRQVKVLEAYLGIQLFSRGNRAVTLTPAGQQYLSEISTHVAAIRRVTGKLIEARGRRVLHIRAYTTFAMRWLIPRLSSFHSSHPEVEVSLTTSLDWVDFDREHVDAAIRLGTGDWAGVQADRLVANELVPVCSPALVASAAMPLKPDYLRQQILLHSLARPDDWANWLQAAKVIDLDCYSGLKYESSVLAYQAAIEGHGFAIAQRVLVDSDLQSGRLAAPFDLTLDMGRNTYYLVFPTSRQPSPELALFRRWLSSQTE
jgi:LysR family glycine cleavage system transcriptional activator